MKNEINLSNLTLKGNELIIREGQAVKATEPIKVEITGVIDAPFKWIEKKASVMKLIDCNVQIDKNNGNIILVINEKDAYSDIITGKLEYHPDFIKFGINSGTQVSSHELAENIKMFRSCFKDKDTAMKLVKDLRNFTAKVNKELEAFKDDRANYALKKSQIVETNLPESFILTVPIFKGQEKQNIEVEINIDADKLTCSLISPSANDYIAEFKDAIIDEQIRKIQELVPELVILEV
jgi:hypothetical protein